MKAAELRNKSEAELASIEKEIQGELFSLRMKHYMGQLQNISELKQKRRDIARVKTILRERTLAGNADQGNG